MEKNTERDIPQRGPDTVIGDRLMELVSRQGTFWLTRCHLYSCVLAHNPHELTTKLKEGPEIMVSQ